MGRRVRLAALPGLVVVGVAVTAVLTSGMGAGASGRGASATRAVQPADPISYSVPPSSQISAGQALFEANCASCHGTDAYGTDRAPNLVGVGAATVDFWVSTGRMPLAISSIQAVRKPPRFDRQQTLQIVAFVASLASASVNGPAVPKVDTTGADLATGNDLFVLNCAGCHTVTGAGDALADGYFAPSLHKATQTQVAEAVRTGPGNMPRFASTQLSDRQVADIVAFVTGPIQNPDNRGGLGLGGIGPVAEGFVALLIGVGGMMLVAFWLGERA
jgi:ubiquinol-cytochrome c reductase cytochrome c subunit